MIIGVISYTLNLSVTLCRTNVIVKWYIGGIFFWQVVYAVVLDPYL